MEVERANDSDSMDALLRRWAETHRHQRTKDRRSFVIVFILSPESKRNIGKPRGGIVASLPDAARASTGRERRLFRFSALVVCCRNPLLFHNGENGRDA